MAVDLTTPELVVEEGARVFEHIENKVRTLQEQVGTLDRVIAAGNNLGMMGALKTMELRARVRRCAGILAAAEVEMVTLHQECTKIAVDNNVDLPQIEGGGGR